MCFAPQRRALFRHLNFQKWSGPGVFCTFWLRIVLRARNGVHFFDISTSKSGPDLVCFLHFDFELCFAPQRRALFRHLNFQKWSDHGVFLCILTWKCASRHNGVQFFISHLASWLRTRRFSEPTFRPSGATNHWKKQSVSRLSYLFAHLHLVSSDSFSSLISSLLIFLFSDLFFSNLSLLSASCLLCFSSVHIVGSLTSKLPSINTTTNTDYPLVNWQFCYGKPLFEIGKSRKETQWSMASIVP